MSTRVYGKAQPAAERISKLLSGPKENLSGEDSFLLQYLLAVVEFRHATMTGSDVVAAYRALEEMVKAAEKLGFSEEELFSFNSFVRDLSIKGRFMNGFIGELRKRLGEDSRN